jgi:tryptophan-rich sensory protein
MWQSYAVAGGVAFALALAGGLGTSIDAWYRALAKPRLQPPDWLFGPAWTIILTCWAAAAGMAWNAAPDAEAERRILIAFGVNGLLFVIWSPLFFRLRRPDWALMEIIPFWLSILACILVVAPLSTTAAWLLVPYIVWVSFAAGLNWKIVRLNAPFGVAGDGAG